MSMWAWAQRLFIGRSPAQVTYDHYVGVVRSWPWPKGTIVGADAYDRLTNRVRVVLPDGHVSFLVYDLIDEIAGNPDALSPEGAVAMVCGWFGVLTLAPGMKAP